jgi:hypothetical protein
MKKFTFYEQVGIVIPGAVLLFGIIFYVPEVQTVLAKDGFSVGGFGVFVLVAYAAGHGVAALGNMIENVYWKPFGGMPTNWVIGRKPRLLSQPQIDLLEARVKQRLGLTIPPLRETQQRAWYPVTRQIYTDVERYGKTQRVETFNGNYGLNRGLAAALLALAVISLIISPRQWYVWLGLLALSVVYAYRMQRFGQHYARELLNQFLSLPAEPGTRKKKVKAPTAEAA